MFTPVYAHAKVPMAYTQRLTRIISYTLTGNVDIGMAEYRIALPPLPLRKKKVMFTPAYSFLWLLKGEHTICG